MVITDSDYEGLAIETLGSLFKITQVFLWDDGSQVSLPQEGSKLVEADCNGNDDDDDSSNLVPDWSDLIVPEDLELTQQMSELGLPLSFHTNKENSGLVKGKKKGTRSKHRRTCQISVDEVLCEASAEEVVSPAEFHDKTSNSLSCISMLGRNESSYYDGAAEVDMTECVSGEVDNSACCTGFANDVSREKISVDMNEAATNNAQDAESLVSNVGVNSKIPPSSDTGVSAQSQLTGAGVNHCRLEHGESLIDNVCLEISPNLCKEAECETICIEDCAVNMQPQANESEAVPMVVEGIGCDQIDVSNNCGEFGDWVAFWDTFYARNYFYNIKTHTSTWDPPPGMEHLAIVGSVESEDREALKAAQECGTQNNTKAPDETLIEDDLERKKYDGNLLSDINTNNEDQSVDHSEEYLERSSCNNGVSCCSVSNILEHIISSVDRDTQAASEDNHNHLENMVIDMLGLNTEYDPSTSKKYKKVKRRQRQRQKSNSESEVLQFQEMPEEYSSAIGKYWYQRYILFSRFDCGIKMDEEGWFSVTPEPIAQYQAERCAGGIIIDCFVGVGGNAIQFAKRCGHVIAIDIDPLKIDYARHNAAIYGVDDKIDFLIGDFFLLAPKLKADTVFLSPPWGGPDYAKVTTYDMKTMLRPHDGYTLFNVARKIASRVVMFLPRNVNFNQLAELSLSASTPWSLEVEKVYLNGKLKAITAYFTDTAIGGCRVNKHIRFCYDE